LGAESSAGKALHAWHVFRQRQAWTYRRGSLALAAAAARCTAGGSPRQYQQLRKQVACVKQVVAEQVFVHRGVCVHLCSAQGVPLGGGSAAQELQEAVRNVGTELEESII
jgi:hypothetical protein